jgi:pimeloyl-ACP methyl ester carboxylesterase
MMTRWADHGAGRRSRRFFFAIAGSLAVSVAFVANAANRNDSILSLDGQKLHIETLGKKGPTVVFEAGLGNDVSTWRRVAGPVAAFAKAVLYDRPGLGGSQPLKDPASPITADAVTTRLHALLDAGPYLASIHSCWTLTGRPLCANVREEVSGPSQRRRLD